jgi:hypothetical protein
MIAPPYQVGPFSLGTAAELVLVTTAIGYFGGYLAGLIWNRLHQSTVKAPGQ